MNNEQGDADDPDPGITEKISSSLGWGNSDDDAYPIKADRIETVTDDEVRISQRWFIRTRLELIFVFSSASERTVERLQQNPVLAGD